MNESTIRALGAFARREWVLALRSRWTQIFTLVFAALALAVAGSGYVLSGGSGFQDLSRTAASLIQVVVLLVPLTALIFGVMALTPEAGDAELTYSQPVARATVLFGKLLGILAALVSAQLVGFGLAGAVLFMRAGPEGVAGFAAVVGGSAALTAIFLSLAAALSAGDTSARRPRHLAVALVVWFTAVVVFDIAVLGAASLLPSAMASRTLMTAAMLNPVDVVRTGTMLAVEGSAAFGAASLALLRFTGGAAGAALWLSASILAWIALPLAWAARRISRADIG